jgi:hypothetical protein
MHKGIHLLIKRYRKEFREENEDLYSEEDYKEAERRYIKLRLAGKLKS